jgi:hypothetical protein
MISTEQMESNKKFIVLVTRLLNAEITAYQAANEIITYYKNGKRNL